MHLAFPEHQGSSSNDNGESNTISGAHNVPEICGGLIVGHPFILGPLSLVDEEVCVAKYNNLCDVCYDGALIILSVKALAGTDTPAMVLSDSCSNGIVTNKQ